MFKALQLAIIPALVAVMQLPATAMHLSASTQVNVEAAPNPALSAAITDAVNEALSSNSQEDFDAILNNIVEELAGNTELPSNIIPLIKQEIMSTQGESSVAQIDWE